MTWLFISIIAYFLAAISVIIDKTLLKKDIPNPIVYTFYIAVLGAVLMMAVIPFGFSVPDILTILIALAAGAIFILALILMFSALRKEEASRVAPMIGGLTPIFVFIFAKYFLKEFLTPTQYLAFVFLIAGSFLISLNFRQKGALQWLKKKLGLSKKPLPQIRKVFWVALPAAILFGAANTLTKFVYQHTDFLTGFIWTRLGSFIAVMALLIIPANRQAITKNFKQTKHKKTSQKRVGGRFLFGQACGGISALLIQYAIFLGSVSLVQALQGLQYAFVFLLVLILTIFMPKILKEEISKEIFWQKAIAVGLIFIGLYFITI